MEDNFDYIDFVQNKRLQQNLQEYEEKDAPKDVQDRVKKMAQVMVDPELGTNIMKAAVKEEDEPKDQFSSPYDYFDADPVGSAMTLINGNLQDNGWIPDGIDGDGCFFYKKAGVRIKVRIAEEDEF